MVEPSVAVRPTLPPALTMLLPVIDARVALRVTLPEPEPAPASDTPPA